MEGSTSLIHPTLESSVDTDDKFIPSATSNQSISPVLKEMLKLEYELLVISNLQQRDKLSVANGIDIDHFTTPFGAVARWWRGDSRNRSVEYATNLCTRACELLLNYDVSKATAIIKHSHSRLKNALMASTIGLNNLTKTYENDPKCAVKLQQTIAAISDTLHT